MYDLMVLPDGSVLNLMSGLPAVITRPIPARDLRTVILRDIIAPAHRDETALWSSGQDAALSRRKQEFDSP